MERAWLSGRAWVAQNAASWGDARFGGRQFDRVSQVLWNVRLLDFDIGRAIDRRALTIDDGRVTAIDEAEGPLPADARDLGGATVLPGLIDAHCHVLSS